MSADDFQDVLVDATPLGRGHALRGIGTAVRGLVEGLAATLTPAGRPALMVQLGQEPVPGFVNAVVPWPEWTSGRLPDPSPATRLEWEIRRRRPGVVHATQHELVPLPRGIRLVATCYDLIPLDEPRTQRGRLALTRHNFARMRRARAVCCFSRAVAEEITEVLGIAPERIHVIPLAPAPAPGPEPIGRERPFVLMSGGLDPHKNPRLGIDALAAGPPDVDLVLAGVSSPDLERDVLEHARLRGVAGRVELAGYVTGERLAGLRAEALAQLVPSTREGFGLPVVEAMAAGTPVLVSDIAVLRETAADAGIVCPLDDPAAWGEALTRLRDDDAHRREVVRAGRAVAAGLSWGRTAQATQDVWRSIR